MKTDEDRNAFLSIYLNTETLNRESVKQKIKSLMTAAFRDSKLSNELKDNQINQIQTKIDGLINITDGIAIFANIDSNESKLIPLTKVLQDEWYLGDTWDLDQLLWINNTYVPSLVININNDLITARRYGVNFDEIFKLNNDFVTSRETKQNMSHSMPSGKTVFGTGTDKAQKDWEKALWEFMNQSKDEIKKRREEIKQMEMGIIVYSKLFSDYIEKYENELKRMFNEMIVISLDKDVKDEKELKEMIKKIILEGREKYSKDEYQKSKENFHNFAEGWEDVQKASDEGRVDTLFIKMNNRKRSYDSTNLIFKTLNNSGKVIVFTQESDGVNDIGAKLRY